MYVNIPFPFYILGYRTIALTHAPQTYLDFVRIGDIAKALLILKQMSSLWRHTEDPSTPSAKSFKEPEH